MRVKVCRCRGWKVTKITFYLDIGQLFTLNKFNPFCELGRQTEKILACLTCSWILN